MGIGANEKARKSRGSGLGKFIPQEEYSAHAYSSFDMVGSRFDLDTLLGTLG